MKCQNINTIDEKTGIKTFRFGFRGFSVKESGQAERSYEGCFFTCLDLEQKSLFPDGHSPVSGMIVAYFACDFLFSFFSFKEMVMQSEEKRSFVRGNFSFNVKFKTMTKDEYEYLKKTNEVIFPTFKQEPGVDIKEREINAGHLASASLINHLVQIDEKLDLILDLLSNDKTVEGLYRKGLGLNISGSGMSIMVNRSVEYGQVIHTKFYLSKFPLVYMDIFGEVVHVAQVDKDGRTHYKLGIKFLDLSINDRESIISSVFQRHRGDIRRIKSEQ